MMHNMLAPCQPTACRAAPSLPSICVVNRARVIHQICRAAPEEPPGGEAPPRPSPPPSTTTTTATTSSTVGSPHGRPELVSTLPSAEPVTPNSPPALASSGGSSDSPIVRGWLNQPVPLPAGYRTTRRELLKLTSLAGAAGCLYVAVSRAKAMSFASPQALINALVPPPAPKTLDESTDRVSAFKRYIADLERRGGGREVPEFPKGADWLNSAPLTLSYPPSTRGSLAGRVVVLDFWTYCCINCIHVLPDLAQLESQFAGAPVTVVGVHSAKFDNEKDSSAIRAAVLRYDISHPVVNDRSMSMWAALGVSSWPTLAVVSPGGRLIAMLSGEGHRQDLEDLITAALQYYGEKGQLDGSAPLPLALERNKTQPAAAVSPCVTPARSHPMWPVGGCLSLTPTITASLLPTSTAALLRKLEATVQHCRTAPSTPRRSTAPRV
ncbi:hypothetical protein Vretimale_8094 [Volvox reticuliferus]|uniref:Thioredoxin domain-containing protein n=1 Tax=Volvox reticuliferus TaxID=1737510 RepID=A0A8J4LMD2_9CHLO|nr:hypothetical protein Vretimale_8094 [Volvox reticuliferus]